MSKGKAETPATAPELVDEHAGKGGSYLVDEAGKRVLVERTLTQDEADAKADAAIKE